MPGLMACQHVADQSQANLAVSHSLIVMHAVLLLK